LILALALLALVPLWLSNLAPQSVGNSGCELQEPFPSVERTPAKFADASPAPSDPIACDALPSLAAAERESASTLAAIGREPGVYFHVRVVTELGSSLREGLLTCFHGPRNLADPNRIERLEKSIENDVTTIRIPLSSEEACFSAAVRGFEPAQIIVKEVRRIEGRWVADDRAADRELVIRIGARAVDVPAISGSIFVEGARRSPRGLLLRVVPSSALTSVPAAMVPRIAVLDPANASFSVPELTAGAWEIEATSDETTAFWTPITLAPGDPPRTLDMRLALGAELSLELRDARTRAVASGESLLLSYITRTASPSDLMKFRETVLRATSNDEGRCEFRALPRDLLLRVFLAANGESGEPLAEITLSASEPGGNRRCLWIHGGDPSRVELFGDVSANELPGTGVVRLRATIADASDARSSVAGEVRIARTMDAARTGDAARTARTSIVRGTRWSLDVPQGSECSIWLERDAGRVTEILAVRASSSSPGSSLGPLVLRPIDFPRVRVEWRNAPLDRSLEIACIDPNHGLPKLREIALNTRDGTVDCERFPGGAVQLKLRSSSGSSIAWTWSESQLRDPLLVDLGADRMRELELYVNSDRPSGSSDLVLVALEPNQGAARCTAVMKLDGGRGTEAWPLFQGPCFYRWNGARSTAIVCGVIEDDEANADRSTAIPIERTDGAASSKLTIRWTGRSCTLDQLGLTGRSGLELVRCAGRSLESVNRSLRQFRWSELLASDRSFDTRDASKLMFDPAACEFLTLLP
jgi:hypothetical protein